MRRASGTRFIHMLASPSPFAWPPLPEQLPSPEACPSQPLQRGPRRLLLALRPWSSDATQCNGPRTDGSRGLQTSLPRDRPLEDGVRSAHTGRTGREGGTPFPGQRGWGRPRKRWGPSHPPGWPRPRLPPCSLRCRTVSTASRGGLRASILSGLPGATPPSSLPFTCPVGEEGAPRSPQHPPPPGRVVRGPAWFLGSRLGANPWVHPPLRQEGDGSPPLLTGTSARQFGLQRTGCGPRPAAMASEPHPLAGRRPVPATCPSRCTVWEAKDPECAVRGRRPVPARLRDHGEATHAEPESTATHTRAPR